MHDDNWALFSVGQQRLAVPAATLREVVPLPSLVPIRDGSLALRGTMPYRGRTIAVLGGRRLLGQPPAPNRSSNRPFWAREIHVPTELAVILTIHGRLLAVSVDRVEGLHERSGNATRLHPSELAHLTLASGVH